MSQPSAYVRIYAFDDFQTDSPATPLPADQLEAELNAIVITTDEIRTNLALIQRDDGELANESVHVDAFTAASLALMGGSWNPEGAWVTLTVYAVGDVVTTGGVTYVCSTAHTSGTFATDLAAVKWVALGGSAGASTYSNTTSALDADTVQEAIDELTLMAGGYLSKSVAGSANVTLTAAEADNTVLKFTGALTGNINVIVPTQERRWVIDNATSGAFTLTVKTSAGTGIAVTQGKKAWLYGDGTNVEKFWLTDDSAVLAANTFTGIQTFGAQTRWTKGSDIASASPLVLGTDGNYFDVTGATGFSAITVAAGTLFMLQFDSTPTLTDGASLDLGGANVTAAAGDEMVFFATAANTVTLLAFRAATKAGQRTFLGLGTASVAATGTSGNTLPFLDGTNTFSGVNTFSAGIIFGNETLSTYDEGSWTPVLTFATPGNLSVVYSTQIGRYVRIGNICFATFRIDTSTFTHTTASGGVRVTGLPFTVSDISGFNQEFGLGGWQGITKATYTDMAILSVPNATYAQIRASGSAVGASAVAATDMPTTGNVSLYGIAIFSIGLS